MDTKFQEAPEAVETAMMDLDLAKMACKDKLKKEGGDDTPPPPPPPQAVRTGKAAPDKAKTIKRSAVEESPQTAVIAAKSALIEARQVRKKAQK